MSNFDPVLIDSGPSTRGWSYYSSFAKCPMLFFWKHIHAQRAAYGWNDYTHPLARGTLFHVGRAHHDAQQWARENGRNPDKLLGPIEAMRTKADQIGDVGREMLPIAEKMWGEYLRTYPIESFKIVGVEQEVEINFGQAYYTARLDRVVQERDGKIRIYDTKTTRRIEGKTIRKYTLHGQFFGFYYLGRKYWGDRFGGVVIDAVDEDGKCIRACPEPAPFLLRRFPYLVEELNSAIEVAKVAYADDPERWPAHPDETICYNPYGKCPAYELCRWGK